MITFNINWLAVLVSTVVNMVIGALWYGPIFGSRWLKELGWTKEDAQGNQKGMDYAIAFLNSFLMAFVLANVMTLTGTTGINSGVLLGALMWLGFTGLSFGVNHAFEDRSLKLWFINAVLYLVGLMVMGAILGAWQ